MSSFFAGAEANPFLAPLAASVLPVAAGGSGVLGSVGFDPPLFGGIGNLLDAGGSGSTLSSGGTALGNNAVFAPLFAPQTQPTLTELLHAVQTGKWQAEERH